MTLQYKIKPQQPDEIDEYNEHETSQTTRSGRVLRLSAWIAEYQQNFSNVMDESQKYFSQEQFIDPIVHYIMTQYGKEINP